MKMKHMDIAAVVLFIVLLSLAYAAGRFVGDIRQGILAARFVAETVTNPSTMTKLYQKFN